MSNSIVRRGKREGNNPALRGADVIPEHDSESEMDDVSEDRLKQLWGDLIHAKCVGIVEALIVCYIRDYYQGDNVYLFRDLKLDLSNYCSEGELSNALVNLVMLRER